MWFALWKAIRLAKEKAFSRRLASLWRWDLPLSLLILAILSYSWMFSSISVPNERSRLYLTVALIDHHTLTIDEPVRRFGKINDWARYEDHYYTDKAPGSSLLGAVVYGLVRCFSNPQDWKIHELINLMRTCVMLPLGLIGFLWLRRLLRRLGLDPPSTDITAVGWIVGTSAFHYSTAFYGHQIVAVCMIGALDLILMAEQRLADSLPASSALGPAWGAGMMAGLAGLTEYQAGIPTACLLVYVVFGPMRRHGSLWLAVALGAFPFMVMLFGYNTLAFGGPFELSYHHLIDPSLRELHGKGIGGVAAPQWQYAYGGLFSLHRGLFTTSPVFGLAVPGLIIMVLRRRVRLAILVGMTWLYFLLFISSTQIWFAGWSFGPRLLVPVMGWVMIPIAYCFHGMGKIPVLDGLGRGLLIVGILYHQTVHAVFPELPESATHPFKDVIVPAWRAGVVSPNLCTKWIGWKGFASLLPLAVLLMLAVVIVVLWPKMGSSRKTMACRAATALGTTLLCCVPLLLIKPGWSERESQRFIQWMEQLIAEEQRLSGKQLTASP
ncbi:MAG TPA: hypothetical protein PLJ27_03060 [Polyangiaceae bacterium]|jgi:hypothetical protein|nr:MAG: hypothetical protein BWY17_00597 [Deltaproteobacteria bacterium ADurb.Bin207]HNS97026.1 hypothetical protein [Polyangiaceae bacterium]HNZ23373.1 hypothetical protein [Polyangiaceae bacterium]HOD22817.1 hypothetical protein [Polyangiaceae bacterium]HOE50195.1 hypothetical protein [Polyangiaceae bacterium]